MADCECLAGWPFFNDRMKENPATAGMYKKNYCLGDNTDCARHQIKAAIGKENVPGDLYPTQQDRVKGIIEKFNARK